jgi:signal transduction histidine kinase
VQEWRVPTPARRAAGFRTELLVVAGLALFGALSLVAIIGGRLPPAQVNERLDTVITTLATIVAGAIAFLSWGRYRVERRMAELYRASGFLVLATANGIVLVLWLAGLDGAVGLRLENPGQWPLLLGIVSRSAAALLFVLGGAAAIRNATGSGSWSFAVFVAPGLLLLAVAGLTALTSVVPTLLDPQTLRQMAVRPDLPVTTLDSPLFVGSQLVPAAGYLLAALLSYLAFRRDRAVTEAVLAIGLVVAGLAQVHSAAHPGAFISLVATGDLLRLVFYSGLLIGVILENSLNVAALRGANDELRRLRDVELAEATLEERARLAREIHDGLAQDLWYGKLKQARLSQLTAGSGEAETLANEVAEALDTALGDARQAVMALRPSSAGTLLEVIARFVEDFGDRYGIRAEFDADGGSPRLSARGQAEILRVVQEALNNVRKHANATLVEVEMRSGDHRSVITVTDNGRGFSADATGSGFGLKSMEERVQLVGGTFAIRAAPGGGTIVEISLPGGADR